MSKFGILESLVVVGQVAVSENIEKDFTTYTAKRMLSCSAPTARKKLNKLVDGGFLVKKEKRNRGDVKRYVYLVTEVGIRMLVENKEAYLSAIQAFYSEVAI